jgi:RNA polymerase sigma-70 factor (ECF subfamily)
VPWSSLADDDHGPTVDPALFRGADDQYPGGWRTFPLAWPSSERTVLAGEVRAQVRAAIDALPDRQRLVITLRDVLGHTSGEVCEMLEISGPNQRVLLHRARAAVRTQLAPYLEQDPATGRVS